MRKYWLERSMKTILKMKILRYKEIFEKLDSDKDGYISCKHIKLSDIDSVTLERLTPVLEKLQLSKDRMDFKAFCLSLDEVMKEN